MRKHHIDYAKGLGMLAVIWGHIMLSGWSYHLVYGFSIPLFFFLSGYVFNREKYPTIRSFAAARFPRLIFPYALFSLITWLLWVGYTQLLATPPEEGYWGPLLQTLIAQGSSGYLKHNTPLWFVPCLLVVELTYFPMRHLRPGRRIAIGAALAVAGYLMIQENGFFDFRKLPYSLEAAASAMLFYISGVLFRETWGTEHISEIVKQHPGKTAGAIALLTSCLLILTSYNGHVTLGSNSLGRSPLVFYLGGYVGIAAVLLTATLLEVRDRERNRVLSRWLGFLGAESFCFMALHFPVKRLVVKLMSLALDWKVSSITHSMKPSLLAFVISLAVTCVIVHQIAALKTRALGSRTKTSAIH